MAIDWLDNIVSNPGYMTGLAGLTGLAGSLGYQNALSSGYENAANAITAGGQQGININLANLNQALQYYEPYYQAGTNALQQYQNLPSGAAASALPSPDIQWEFNPEDQQYKIMQEDLAKSINQQAASRGLYNSMPAQRLLADEYRRLQASEVANQYGRAVDTYNRQMQNWGVQNALAQNELLKQQNLMTGGLGATGNMVNALTSTGRNVADLYGTIGQAQGQAALGAGQTKAGTWQDLASLPMDVLTTYGLLSGQMPNALAGTAGLAGTAAGVNALTPGVVGAAGATGAGLAGTQAAADVISGTQAGTLSALGSGGTGTNALAGGTSALPVLGAVGGALGVASGAFDPILSPLASGIGSLFGMGGTSGPGQYNVLSAWVSGAPAGTNLGYGQTLPASMNEYQIKALLGNINADPALVKAIKNKDTDTLRSMGVLRSDGYFDLNAAKNYSA